MARRLRISAMAAAALGPDAVEAIRRDARARGMAVEEEARAQAPRDRRRDPNPLPVLRVASERLDRPPALP